MFAGAFAFRTAHRRGRDSRRLVVSDGTTESEPTPAASRPQVAPHCTHHYICEYRAHRAEGRMVSLEAPAIGVSLFRDLASIDAKSLANCAKVPDWADAYRTADPFPHLVIDGLFPEEVLGQVLAEIGQSEIDPEKNFYGSFHKRKTSDVTKFGPATRRLIEELNAAPFLQFLEQVTGIPALIPDPYLEGGGVHQIGNGGFLKVHTDFNWHQKLRLHRRLNILLYLNPDWRDEWNGHLELWDPAMTACRKKLAPVFNRLVIFSTSDGSYHGHPEPLRTPEGVTRNSIALYYYTAERPASEIRFGKSVMTNYQERPDEKFAAGKLKHRIHQALIRNPVLRRVLGR
jgi:hypothetical protein